jgi:hypothetical protein
MAYPEHDEVAEALLCFIFLNGGPKHSAHSRATYKPLADFFELSGAERTAPRTDKRPGTRWENQVQWARQRNINRGLIVNPPKDGSERGIWTLSPEGSRRARSIVKKYRTLKLS